MRFQKPVEPKKPKIGVRKVSLSLPPAVVDDLDALSSTMGLSRSAFLSALLAESLPPLRATMDTVVALKDGVVDGDDSSLQRYNAGSKDAIDSFLRGVIGGVQDDLFDK
jgi:hypothetical protein